MKKLLDTENVKMEEPAGVTAQGTIDQSMSHKIVTWIKTQVTFVR